MRDASGQGATAGDAARTAAREDSRDDTGLGLAVVHGIVTSHGGRISVSSAVGAGTRVDVILPAAARAVSAAE